MINRLPSGATFPDSNQRLTVGLRPPGKAYAQHAIESDALGGFALPAGKASRIFVLPEVVPEKFLAKRLGKTFRIPYLKIERLDPPKTYPLFFRSQTAFSNLARELFAAVLAEDHNRKLLSPIPLTKEEILSRRVIINSPTKFSTARNKIRNCSLNMWRVVTWGV